jgi:hypothetical protein
MKTKNDSAKAISTIVEYMNQGLEVLDNSPQLFQTSPGEFFIDLGGERFYVTISRVYKK